MHLMADLTPQAFAEKWSRMALSERSSYQEHFRDLCAMLGQPTPTEVDRKGDFYTFEKVVEKSGGGKGFADVWRKGRFAIEYKGRHKDLKAALSQLQKYQGVLSNPPLLMVTDTHRYEIHTTFTDVVTKTYEFTNEDLPKPENLRVLREMFNNPDALKPTRTIQSVTEEAAGKFAQIADGLRACGVDPQEAAHFLNRLLFCLFVEDVGLLPKRLFERVAERGFKKPETFNRNIGELFGAMATGGEFSLEDVPHFNGGLFTDAEVVPLKADERFPEPPSVDRAVFVTTQRSRWGSYSPKTRAIRLNAALRRMPRWVLEAVVAHELAHAVHPDHSPAFWNLLRRVCPETDRAKAFLTG